VTLFNPTVIALQINLRLVRVLSYLRAWGGGMWQIANISLSSMLVEDVIIMVSRYWQVMCYREIWHYLQGVRWHKVWQWKSATIGGECAGTRCNNRRAQLLVRSVLVKGAKMEEHNYWRGVHWCKVWRWQSTTICEECTGTRRDNGRVQLFARSALAEEVAMTEVCNILGDKCDLWKKEPR